MEPPLSARPQRGTGADQGDAPETPYPGAAGESERRMDGETGPPRTRRNTGRPCKPEPEQRAVKLYFRVTPAELAAIKTRADELGLRVSDFARSMVRDGKVRVSRSRNFDPALFAQISRLGNNLNQCLVEARRGNFPPDVAAAAEDALRETGAFIRKLVDASNPED